MAQKDHILIEFERSYVQLHQEIGATYGASRMQANRRRSKRQSSSPVKDSALNKYLDVRAELQMLTRDIKRFLDQK